MFRVLLVYVLENETNFHQACKDLNISYRNVIEKYKGYRNRIDIKFKKLRGSHE